MKSTDTRSQEILDAVVRLNVETGRPVSSGLVARALGRRYSSATVRTVMKRLEDDGLLVQPHTSAGRTPTDAGFREFVDHLQRGWPVVGWEPPRFLRQRVDESLRATAGSHELMKVLAGLLSQLTDNISIVLGPGWDTVRAQRVDLYPKEGGRILMVLVLENAMVRTVLVALPEAYPAVVVEAAGTILSERVAGRTVGDIRRGVLTSLEISVGPAARCARELIQRGRALFDELEEGELELEGVERVLDQPEFSDPEPLKALVRFIESPRSIRDALNQLDRQTEGALGVWIGTENPLDSLRPFGLVLHRCELDGRRAIMAVLGPRRMPYQRAFTGIDVLQRSLQGLS
ncbi:MAG: heat-inducible transcriptional repressor HrcA [Candidatus Krumholzibacteriia bacterium]